MTEAELTRRVIKKLNSLNKVHCWKQHGGPMQKKGVSDIVGVCRGHFFAVEMKKPGAENTLTELQAAFIKRIKLHGGRAGMATNYKEARAIALGHSTTV